MQERVLAALRRYLEAPDVIERAVEVHREERQRLARAAAKSRRTVERELAATEREIELVMRAVTEGAPTSVTVPRLKALAAKKEDLEAKLAEAEAVQPIELHPEAAKRYAAKVEAVHRALSAGDEAGDDAVRVVRELMLEIRVTPTPKGDPVGLEVAGDLAALLKMNETGTPVVSGLVAGARFSRDRHILSSMI